MLDRSAPSQNHNHNHNLNKTCRERTKCVSFRDINTVGVKMARKRRVRPAKPFAARAWVKGSVSLRSRWSRNWPDGLARWVTHNNSVFPSKDGKFIEASDKVPARSGVASYKDSERKDGEGVHRALFLVAGHGHAKPSGGGLPAGQKAGYRLGRRSEDFAGSARRRAKVGGSRRSGGWDEVGRCELRSRGEESERGESRRSPVQCQWEDCITPASELLAWMVH